MIACSQCNELFIDEHNHGLCFGCKVKGVTFGSVRQGPSVWALEKQAVADARAAGIEPERYTGPSPKVDKKAKAEKDLKKITDKLRAEVRSG